MAVGKRPLHRLRRSPSPALSARVRRLPYAPMLPGSTLKPGHIVDDRLMRFT